MNDEDRRDCNREQVATVEGYREDRVPDFSLLAPGLGANALLKALGNKLLKTSIVRTAEVWLTKPLNIGDTIRFYAEAGSDPSEPPVDFEQVVSSIEQKGQPVKTGKAFSIVTIQVDRPLRIDVGGWRLK